MDNLFKKRISDRDMPSEFSTHTIKVINRIEERPNVMGIMYFRNDFLQLATVPENMVYPLSNKLPALSSIFRRVISEIDVLDELIAFRIETNLMEIIVTGSKEFSACVVQQVAKKSKKRGKK
ncbi:uncharacterized protein LOC123701716 isoform X2 [Colias croceus]|uniref:uncharacterized protein LOC123701716 isoform X2 n=1 Tax=Colias crocea TaxID=72248 RepID=UPI001E2810D1|nr:uncharacterized protein LOC123701716 isoform X2 [Colias croceus]